MAANISLTDKLSPSAISWPDPMASAAFLLAVIISSHLSLPLSMLSRTKYSVIILAILAGGSATSAFVSYRILPVLASIKIADFTSRFNVGGGTASAACRVEGFI
ncbi:hypothetical protein D3C73_816670 [compost metagenome]